jgi:hypothetical protein
VQDALEEGVRMREGVVKMSASELDQAISLSLEFTLKREKVGRLGGLTRDMVAAINIYTMASPFYKVVNQLLRDVDRSPLIPFFPFLRLIMTGLRRLPKETVAVCRGVPVAFADLDGAKDYVVGGLVVWWPFSSSTQDKEMLLKDPQFLGTSGKRTLFIINPATARNVQDFSSYKKEAERLILPGTRLVVMAVKVEGDLTTIYLEEDTKAAGDLIATGADIYKSVEPGGFYGMLEPEHGHRTNVDAGHSAGGDTYDEVKTFSGGGGGGGYAEIGAVAAAADGPQVTHIATTVEDMYGSSTSSHSLPVLDAIEATKHVWFRPDLTKDQVTEMVMKRPVGSFFVMRSNRTRDADCVFEGRTKAKCYFTVVVKQFSRSDKALAQQYLDSMMASAPYPERMFLWRGVIEESDDASKYYIETEKMHTFPSMNAVIQAALGHGDPTSDLKFVVKFKLPTV